jgi:hypothetical protein
MPHRMPRGKGGDVLSPQHDLRQTAPGGVLMVLHLVDVGFQGQPLLPVCLRHRKFVHTHLQLLAGRAVIAARAAGATWRAKASIVMVIRL